MRLNLEFGQGWITAFIDLKKGNIVEYDSSTADAVHEAYGGKQHYHSCSGCSGAGWIDGGLHLRPVNVYRVDTNYPMFDTSNSVEVLPGRMVFHPFSRGGSKNQEYPVITVMGEGIPRIHVLDNYPWLKPCPTDSEEFVMAFHQPRYRLDESLTDAQKGEVTVYHKTVKMANLGEHSDRIIRRVLEGLYHSEFATVVPESNNWWIHLGLYPRGDSVWKITNSIIRYAVPMSELTTEKLQKLSPANVQFFSPDFYVQERSEKYSRSSNFVATARETIDGEEYEYELELNTSQIVNVLRGRYETIREECLEGCRNKAASDAEYRRNTRQAEQFKARFGELVEQHGDRVVTIADSVAASNCEVGSCHWRDEHYPGRDEVSLKELSYHQDNSSVWRVLRYILRDIKLNGE